MGITLVIKAEDFHKRNVVYRIDFGDFFYIGCTTQRLKKRMYNHHFVINKLLYTGEINPDHFLLPVIIHLTYNVYITQGIVSIVKEFKDDPHEMLQYERALIAESIEGGFCLNRPWVDRNAWPA